MAHLRKVIDLASDDTDAPMSRPPDSDSARGFASASSSAARPSSPATRELMEHIDVLQALLSSGPKSSTLSNCAAPLGELAAQLRQLQERRASPHSSSSSSRASDLQFSQPHRNSMDWDQHDEEQKESAASSSAAAAAASSSAAAAAAASYPAAYSTPYDSSSSQVFLSASGTLMSDDELVARMIAEEEEQERVRRKQRQEQEEREFQQLLLREATCAACGTQPDGASELVQICDEARQRGPGPSCAHKVCHACLQRYLKDVQAALAAPSAELLTEAELHCPAPGCQSQLQQWQIRAVLPPAEFEQLLTQCFQNALKRKSAGAGGAGAAKIVHCPNPQCSNVFEAVEGSGNAAAGAAGAAADVGVDGQVMSPASKLHRSKHRFRCNACSTVFCGECSAAPYHDGFDCAAFAQYKDAKKCRFCSISLTAANRAKPASVHAAAAAAAAAHGHQHLKAHHAIGAAAAAVGSAVNNFLRAAAGGVAAPAAAAAAPAAAVRPPSAYSQSAASFAPSSMLADVCNSPECIEKRGLSCESKLPCGHACGGVSGEKQHLLCLKEECPAHPADVDNEEEYCSVCYVEGLGQAPTIRLGCGHMFHFKCISDKLAKGWPGARITFGFLNCPLCKQVMQHPSLAALMDPLLRLKSDVQAKASARLKPEGLENDAAFTSPQGKYYGRRDEYALDRFAFYMCAKCDRPYFGGRRQCEEVAMQQAEQFNKEQLMCGGCTAGPDVKSCNVHGKDFIEHKCKFCCNIATWYCWGSTHFCDSCHKRQETGDYLTKKALSDLPQCPGPGKCPVGTKHPQNGTAEFTMGCGVCRPRDNAV